jgi:hypothetical protein
LIERAVRKSAAWTSSWAAIVETCDLDGPGDAACLDQLLHPPSGDAEQVAGGDHGGQRTLGPTTPFEQPVREVRPGAHLRDRDVEGARAGVELPPTM